MKIYTLDPATGYWQEALIQARGSIRVECSGVTFDIEDEKGGVRISTQVPMAIDPLVSNSIIIKERTS